MNADARNDVSDSITRLRRGDPDVLTATISRYQHRLYRYLLRLVQDPATAEDLFQQTWLLVIERIARYDARRSFEPWLFTIAHHLAIDCLRGRRGESLDAGDESGACLGDRLTSREPDALSRLLDFERSAMLSACLDGLPAIHREVLTLRFEEEMKLEEISEVAGVPLSTVKSRLQRALEGLRTSLEARVQRRPTDD